MASKGMRRKASPMRETLEEIAPLMAQRRGQQFSSLRDEVVELRYKDASDATAKRGFRVQVPKRLMIYVGLVFLFLPILLFGYVEVHRIGQRKKLQKKLRNKARYNEFDPNQVLPHLMTDEDAPTNDAQSENATLTDLIMDGLNDVAEVAKEDLDFLVNTVNAQDTASVIAVPPGGVEATNSTSAVVLAGAGVQTETTTAPESSQSTNSTIPDSRLRR